MKYQELPFDKIDELYENEQLSPTLIARRLEISPSLVSKYISSDDFKGTRRTKQESMKIGVKRALKERVERCGHREFYIGR